MNRPFNPNYPGKTKVPLARFIGSQQKSAGIPYQLLDYFELIDWTGRVIRHDKKGYIPNSEPKIIQKLGIDSATWLDSVKNFHTHFYIFIGPKDKLTEICKKQNKKWLTGITSCRRLFNQFNPLSS